MNLIKKLFVYTMVFTMCMAFAPIGDVHAAAGDLVAGDLIKSPASSAVYYYDGTNRLAFPNSSVYFSWYEDFDNVVTITADELAAINYDGLLVTMRPGTNMVKIESDPKVYAVEPGGVLRWVDSEETALALYGADWSSMIVDVSDAFWFWYDKTNAVDNKVTADAHPAGTLISYTDTDDIYYVDADGTKRLVSEAGFTANNFNADYVVTGVADTITYTTGTSVTEAEAGLFPIAEGDVTTPPVAGGDLSVALSSDTPAAASIPKAVDNIVFTKINLTAGSDADAKINTIGIHRAGLGSDSDFASVTIYSDGVKLANSRTSFNSDHIAVFNLTGGWEIPAGTTKVLEVRANVGTDGTYNKLGILSADDISITAGNVSGTFPVYGNEMTAVTINDLGAVTVDGEGSTSQTKKIGETDVQLAYFSLEEMSGEEDLFVYDITLKNVGTAKDSASANFVLKSGSTVLAETATMVNDYITFNLAEPFSVEKSSKEYLKVYGDIMDGDATKIEFILKDKTDLNVIGDIYGYNVTVTNSVTTGFGAAVCAGTTETTIDGAELNISLDSETKDTPDEVTNYEFARFNLSAGQDVKVTGMTVRVDETDYSGNTAVVEIDDLELVDANDGTVYTLTQSAGADGTDVDAIWAFDSEEVMVYEGETTTLIVRGDIPSGVDNGDQYNIKMTVDPTNLVAETAEGDAIDNFSVSSLTGKKVTVKSSTLIIKTTPMDSEDVVSGTAGVILVAGSMEAGTASDVTVERVKFVEENADELDTDNIIRAVFVTNPGDDEVEEQVITSFTTGELDFSELDIVVPAGSTNAVNYELRVDVTTETLTTHKTVQVEFDTVTARDTDNDTVAAKQADGTTPIATLAAPQTITLKETGILLISNDILETGFNKDRYILAGNEAFVGRIKLRALFESIKLQDLKLTNSSADDEDSVSSVCLYEEMTDEDAVACTTLDANDVAFFNDIDYIISGGTHYLYVKVTTPNSGDGASFTADSGDVIQFSIMETAGHVVAEGVDSGNALAYGDNNSAQDEGEILFDINSDGNTTYDEAGDIETGDTKAYEIVATQLTAVDFLESAGTVNLATNINGAGTYNVAILAITNAETDNTDSEGVELDSIITKLNLRGNKDTATLISATTIERIGGTQSATAMDDDAVDESGETTGLIKLDDFNIALGTDAYINAGETAYFLVKMTITPGANVDTITISADDLDGGDDDVTILYSDDGVVTEQNELRLDYTTVDGIKIDEVTS